MQWSDRAPWATALPRQGSVFEDLDIKKRLFADLDALAPGHAVLASNTSSMSITAMASVTRRPEKVVGMHFFNPAVLLTQSCSAKTLSPDYTPRQALKNLVPRAGSARRQAEGSTAGRPEGPIEI